MNKIDTTLLDGLIVGRIDPHIYAFTTNTVPNYLKVGDTYRPVNVRLNEWREHFPNLHHESNWEWIAKTEDGKYFRDFAVHYYLEHIKRYHRLQPDDIEDLPYYSKEFFENATPEDIDAAIIDIEQRASQVGSPYQFYSEDRLPEKKHFSPVETYDPRPNQKDTIEKFKMARAKGRRHLLMYAVMRFGKSFTSMCCATEMDAKVVLIVSAKGDVSDEWMQTVESHVRFADYVFIDSADGKKVEITKNLQQGKRVAVFLTLQDLMGENIKSKHEDLFRNNIDLLIVDETHFGARAEEYGRILRKTNELTATQAAKEYRLSGESTIEDLENGLKLIKELKVDTTLHLSGTPYRILMGSEFKPEDIIAFYQFTDIIDDKEKFDREHCSNDDYKEWDNPYYGFPQMIRFAFNPNESARKLIEQLKEQGKSAQLNELFRPQSISKDNSAEKKHRHFIHEKEILDLLQVIDGSAEDENLLGFLSYDKLKEGKMCRHMVFVLPFCASCDAMEKLLSDNKEQFINLNEYEIVNISGVENTFASTESIKLHIESLENQGKKSITLTVNRMLTGSTVKHWDTMLFLKDVSSPQEYDQAIFRLQNQYVTKYKDEAGDEIKYNMKPQTLLVDFDPNRMFVMQEQKSKIYNVNVNESGNDELEERLRRELEISPIIVLNKGKMGEVVPMDIMNAVREYSANITVMDEACEIPTDFEILNDPNLWDMIKDLEPIDSKKGLEIKPNEGEGDDYDNDSDPDEFFVPPTNDGDDDNDTPKANKAEDDDKRDKRLAALFARVLFFALLTDDTVRSLQQVIEVIARDKTNQRIARNVGLKFQQLRYLRKHIDPFVLSDLDYKISNTNDLLRDITHAPLERVESALKKFGRLSDSEIVTPAAVADKMVALLPKDAMDNNAKVLDIASKQGEFACALYKYFGADKRNNIYALPTSSLTYEFTYKVFKLLDIPTSNIFSTFNSYSLIGENNEQYIQILENMKFNAIVGNPPYQGDGSSQLYPHFYLLSRQLGNFSSLIFPTGWQKPCAATAKGLARLNREEIKADPQIRKIDVFHNVFQGVSGASEVNVVFWQKDYDNELGGLQLVSEDGSDPYEVKLKWDLNDLDKPNEIKSLSSLVKNTIGFKGADAITTGRSPYGLNTDAFKDAVKNGLEAIVDEQPKMKDDIKIYGKLNSTRTIRYVRKTYKLPKLKEQVSKTISKYKVFIPYAWGNMSESAGLGGAYSDILIAEPNEICTQTYVVSGCFDTKEDAIKHAKYILTPFARALLYANKQGRTSAKPTWKDVPIQDYTEPWWNESIEQINEHLFDKYDIPQDIRDFVNKNIQPRSEENIRNM